MLAMAILGAAIGAVLGSQFKMFVLGPATLFAVCCTVAAGFVRGLSAYDVLIATLAILSSLQCGYFAGGVAASYLSVQTKMPRRSWTPSQY
jgi:hypothetical protein